MKQPLVECDILVEVASDRLTAQKGDFLIVYFTDAERRRAIAVKTFQPRANGATPPARLALPAPKETRGRKSKPKPKPKQKPKSKRQRKLEDTAIEWWRALGQPHRQVSVGDHVRQAVFDRGGEFISDRELVTTCQASEPNVYYAMKPMMGPGWVARNRENGMSGYRLTQAGGAYLENFRRRADAS